MDLLADVLDWALIHDVPEVVCGDMPTPTKKRIKDLFGFDMEDLYDSIDPTYARVKTKISEEARIIVKCADLIESHWFIKTHGIGNHAKVVGSRIDTSLNEFIHFKLPIEWAGVIRKVHSDILNGEFYE